MNRIQSKINAQARRKLRIRKVVVGTTEQPRLVISISNLHVSAQIIDDTKKQTLVSATTIGKKTTGTLTEKAISIGNDIAKKAKAKKISKVVFDRNGKKYHGRIAALAQAAREKGLEF